MSQGLLVSICYIANNSERLLAKAIDGFMMQKTDFDFDIVIANDSSTDGTSQILQQYQQKHPGKIKVISSERKEGTLPNLINCTKLCRGKYIAFCSGEDVWLEPDKLQKQVNFLEANPEYQ
ncbi:MAG: glycosyltransferase family 2 protein [Mucilaginibacter sp.]|uniref:glycosyltransferase family 2 protein n=1 Tax=Mucilaginibacter sp. L3T2-6 TaxID=3062491 RepID=UPI0026764954|nr:glycosyltransferase family 2 protein [Mucilaginibacter sp. L3T2-6]MDO3644424.1 glycosyltransferase family 2 protein [Mucilaginibacter sp. L3T2-6]MDV6216876.1 glycosyltransferase family 2 protein [Mucilaginibacter sp. L3T2-6]